MSIHIPKDSPAARQRACDAINQLSNTKAWEVTIKPYKKRRVNEQNRYYWGVVIQTIAEETGNDKNDLHEYFLGESQGWIETEVLGQRKKKPARRSHDMTIEEFNDYVTWIQAFAAQELGIIIPSPGETIL